MVPVARCNLLAERGRFAIVIAGVGFAVLRVSNVIGTLIITLGGCVIRGAVFGVPSV
jgi:hypothetical protein